MAAIYTLTTAATRLRRALPTAAGRPIGALALLLGTALGAAGQAAPWFFCSNAVARAAAAPAPRAKARRAALATAPAETQADAPALVLALPLPGGVPAHFAVGAAGNLVLNGQALTLRSSSRGTALMGNSGAGIVSSGTAVVQRYLDSLRTAPGYRHYSPPVTGNPYPAPLDYSRVAPADRPNLESAMYMFESTSQDAGAYRPYNNGVGNSLVGSSQGFFVRVSDGQPSGSLTFRNAHRLINFATQVPVRRPAADLRPLVQLNLRGTTGPADPLYAYAQVGATTGFDPAYDAHKLPNSTGLNLASVASTGESLSIDGRPVFAAGAPIPLTVGVPVAGAYTLTAATLNNIPAGLDAFLTDATTGQTVNLRLQPAYAFTLTAAQIATLIVGRFSLHFAPQSPLATAPALTAATIALYPNPAHGAFTVRVPALGSAPLRAELLNALGQVVRRQDVTTTATGTSFVVETTGLAAGVYTLRLQAGPLALVRRVVLD